MADRYRVHALVLGDPDRTVDAVRQLVRKGYTVADVHTPFPVHGITEAMGLAPTRISYATLAGAGAGVALALGFQAWSSVVDWPLNIGGKSYLALPALVPVTFELGVLLAAFATVGALVAWSRLRPRGRTPESQPHAAASDDRFVVLVRETDAGFDPEAFRRTAGDLGVDELIEGWQVR
jgi:hypothetical protein